jgi:hypothetical protein
MRTLPFQTSKPENPPAPPDFFYRTMQAHFRAHAGFYGVNADTLISSDVLNQYIGLVRLFELFPGAPHTIAPYLFSWEIKPYVEYFKAERHPASGFLAAADAYVPQDQRQSFDAVLNRLEITARSGVAELKAAMAQGRAHEARGLCSEGAEALRQQIGEAAAIVTPPQTDNVIGLWQNVRPGRLSANRK